MASKRKKIKGEFDYHKVVGAFESLGIHRLWMDRVTHAHNFVKSNSYGNPVVDVTVFSDDRSDLKKITMVSGGILHTFTRRKSGNWAHSHKKV